MISSAVAMHGPIGAKVSKDLPSQLVSGIAGQVRRPSSRAETSIRRGVAEHRALPVLLLHHLGRALDHQRKLGLVHERPGHGVFRQHDGVARPDHRVRVLHEHVERPRLALRVLPVVGDAAKDFAGPRQRRLEPHLAGWHGLALGGELLQRRLQPVEIVDDALHRELRRVALLDRAGNVDHAAIGHQARQDLAVRSRLKQHKFHEFLPLCFGAEYSTSPQTPASRRAKRRAYLV